MSDDLDIKVLKKMVESVIGVAFDQAAANFRDNPHGDRWKALEDAMYARQALSNPDSERLIEKLRNVGVGTWVETLRALHEGKAEAMNKPRPSTAEEIATRADSVAPHTPTRHQRRGS